MGKAARWVRSLLGGKKEQRVAAGEDEIRGEDKKRWSFGRSWRERAEGPSAKACTDFYLASEKERNRHAIIVAAATAAAADAAVAAAQAAAAVVKLTTYGRRMVAFDREEERAALKIQCVFRGHLARKALMALRSLVKLQALVRGHIVRKRLAVNNIRKWGALDAVDSGVRPRRTPNDRTRIIAPEIKHRRSKEMSDDSRTEPHSSSLQSRRLSTTPVDAALSRSEFLHGFDDCPGIAEINVGRPKPRTRRASNSPDQSRLTTPRSRNSQDPDDYCCQSSTTQSTPRFFNSSVELNGPMPPVTPRRGIWTQLDSPNYMANTQSFKAKLRSQSVPKLRSEPGRRDSSMETVVEPRACAIGLGVRRSCSQA